MLAIDLKGIPLFSVLTQIGPGHEPMAVIDSKKSKEGALVYCSTLLEAMKELNTGGDYTMVYVVKDKVFKVLVSTSVSEVLEYNGE